VAEYHGMRKRKFSIKAWLRGRFVCAWAYKSEQAIINRLSIGLELGKEKFSLIYIRFGGKPISDEWKQSLWHAAERQAAAGRLSYVRPPARLKN